MVGGTGTCGPFNAIELNNLTPLHAVLWQNGKPIDLGNLGGDGKSFGIFATGLNDYGQVVGASDTAGDASFHGFLWQRGHITDLGTLKGDAYSLAIAIGNNGLVLGVSLDANFNPRAALWRNGTATDLNTLVPTDATLSLQTACSINEKGEIIGFAALKSNPSETHAYMAKPADLAINQGRDRAGPASALQEAIQAQAGRPFAGSPGFGPLGMPSQCPVKPTFSP